MREGETESETESELGAASEVIDDRKNLKESVSMCVCWVCVCVCLVCECLPVVEDACATVHVSLSAHACAFVPGCHSIETGSSQSRDFVTRE